MEGSFEGLKQKLRAWTRELSRRDQAVESFSYALLVAVRQEMNVEDEYVYFADASMQKSRLSSNGGLLETSILFNFNLQSGMSIEIPIPLKISTDSNCVTVQINGIQNEPVSYQILATSGTASLVAKQVARAAETSVAELTSQQ